MNEPNTPAEVGSNTGLGVVPGRAEVAHLDDGEAWSFCRTVMSDGRDIRQWHPDEGYEMQSARMDAQAAKRGDQLMVMVRALLAAERERCAKLCDEAAKGFGGVAAGKMATERGRLVHEAMAAGAVNCAAAIRGA